MERLGQTRFRMASRVKLYVGVGVESKGVSVIVWISGLTSRTLSLELGYERVRDKRRMYVIFMSTTVH